MKKISVLFTVAVVTLAILFFTPPSKAETLKGGAVYDEIPKGFFGTWHVTSKIDYSNNAKMFNPLSVDIWNLSGAGNVLVLENATTGAKSSIQVTSNKGNFDGKTLKFQRTKEKVEGKYKIIQKESPEFVLEGDIFRGFDTFIVEKYENNKLISKDIVKYKVIGQKLSGESKINDG